MRWIRRICWVLFVIIYLTTCPLLILYALGYVLKPGSEQGIVKTGLIAISTNPPGAAVYLGNRRYTKRTPTVLRNLLPGEYSIKLVLKHHQPWTRTVAVEAQRATALNHILLLPQRLREDVLLAEPFEDLIPIGGRFLLLRSTTRTGDAVVFDVKTRHSWPLVPMDSPYARTKLLGHVTIPESPSLLLRISGPTGEQLLWIDRLEQDAPVEDVTRLIPKRPTLMGWDSSSRGHLFVLQGNTLIRVDLAEKAVYPTFLEDVRGYGVSNRMLYALMMDGTLVRMDLEGKAKERLLETAIPIRPLFGRQGAFRIMVGEHDAILFLGERGELLAGRLPYRFVDRDVVGVDWLPPNQLLLWTREQLGVLEFPEAPAGEEVTESLPELQWVLKRRVNLEQAFWVFHGSHVVFRDDTQVFLLELDPDGIAQPALLLHVKKQSAVMYSDETGALYYLDRSTGELRTIQLIPAR